MRLLSILAALLVTALVVAAPIAAAEPVELFNGKNLEGWTYFLRAKNAKMEDVWSVEDGILICQGRPIGYLRTKDKYTNYKLIVQWRWPEGKRPGNSGVLLRVIGEDKVWPKSIEAQLQSGNAGDFWNIGQFQMTTAPERTRGRNTKKLKANEKEIGQWNQYEITCDGGLCELKVNGEVLNKATDCAEVSGYIALQSEGAEIHFRKVTLIPLDK